IFSLMMQLWVQVPVTCGALALFLAVVAPWIRGTPLTGRPAVLAGRSLALASLLLLPLAVAAAGNLGAGVPFPEWLGLAMVVTGTPVAALMGLHAAARAARFGRGAAG